MRSGSAIWMIFVVGLILTSLFASVAIAQDFSADLISSSREGTFQGKIFFTEQKLRMETGGAITITRLDKNLMWMLMPQEKMYMELPLQPQNIVAGQDKVPGETERQLMGKEVVDGKMANKYRIVYIVNNQRQAVYSWLVEGMKIPVKTAAEDGSWTLEYKNVNIGPQPEDLFEIPGGYQKVSYDLSGMGTIPGYDTEK